MFVYEMCVMAVSRNMREPGGALLTTFYLRPVSAWIRRSRADLFCERRFLSDCASILSKPLGSFRVRRAVVLLRQHRGSRLLVRRPSFRHSLKSRDWVRRSLAVARRGPEPVRHVTAPLLSVDVPCEGSRASVGGQPKLAADDDPRRLLRRARVLGLDSVERTCGSASRSGSGRTKGPRSCEGPL